MVAGRGGERERLRATFDEVAELYDRARPAYPVALLDDLVALACLGPGSRLLEVGPGTGQATAPLAERGISIVAVELGAALAAVARRNLARFPHVEVVNADVEKWEPPRASFDAVAAFTAFHWLDPETRVERCARLLRPGRSLVVVKTEHVQPDDADPFFAAVQDAYVRAGEGRAGATAPEAVPDLREELEAGGWFGRTVVRRFVWDVEYDLDSYLSVLDTYSGHRSLAPEVRGRLYADIAELIGSRRIRKTYLAILHVARRR